MAAIGNAYAQGISITANTTAWVDICEISAGSFTANKKYLIVAEVYAEHASAANEVRVRLVRGTTPTVFTDASAAYELTSNTQKTVYGYLTVFTQPGTTELVKLQISVSATQTGEAHLGNIFVMNLSDDLVENTDWFYNEVTADYDITASLVAQAAVTFTPNGTDDWLIIANGVYDVVQITGELIMSIHDSVSGVDEPRIDVEGEDATNEFRSMMLARTFTPSAAAHTFSARFAGETDTADLVLSSRIFALNLNKFKNHAFAYATAEEAPAASPSWTTTRTLAPTPDVTGDWFVLGSFGNDVGTLTDNLATRLQINPSGGGLASDPAYGDDAPEADSWDATDVCPFHIFTRASLTSGAARTINLDVQMIAGTTLRVQDRHLVAFSMELATSQPPAAQHYMFKPRRRQYKPVPFIQGGRR